MRISEQKLTPPGSLQKNENHNSPLIPVFLSLGFPVDPDNGSKPIDCFTDSDEEYAALLHGVGIYDSSSYCVIQLSGRDVLDFLHRVSTNSVRDLPISHTRYTLFTNDKGKLFDCTLLAHLGTHYWLLGSKGTGTTLFHWLNRYIISDDVHVDNSQASIASLDFFGPQSTSFLTLLFGDDINYVTEDMFKILNLDQESFYVFSLPSTNTVTRYRVLGAPNNISALLRYALKNKGVFECAVIGENAFQRFRIENGLLDGTELTDEFNPHEAGLTRYIDFKKGCYIGQEVISRLDTYDKVQKQITGVHFPVYPKGELSLPAQILTEDKIAGTLTAICPIHAASTDGSRPGSAIGMAYLRKEFLHSENCFVEVDEQRFPLSAVPFPIEE